MDTNTAVGAASGPDFRCPRGNPFKYHYPPAYPFPPPRDPGESNCRPFPHDGLFPPGMPKPFSWPSDWPWPPLLKSQAPEWSPPSPSANPSALSIALYVILGISILVILVTLFVFWRSHNHTSKRMTWRHSIKDSKIPLKQSSEISVTLHINESEVEFLKCSSDADSPFPIDYESTEVQANERVRRHSLPHRLPMFVNDVFILPSPPRSIALNELRIVNGSVIGTPGFAATEVAKSQNLSALSLVLQGD